LLLAGFSDIAALGARLPYFGRTNCGGVGTLRGIAPHEGLNSSTSGYVRSCGFGAGNTYASPIGGKIETPLARLARGLAPFSAPARTSTIIASARPLVAACRQKGARECGDRIGRRTTFRIDCPARRDRRPITDRDVDFAARDIACREIDDERRSAATTRPGSYRG